MLNVSSVFFIFNPFHIKEVSNLRPVSRDASLVPSVFELRPSFPHMEKYDSKLLLQGFQLENAQIAVFPATFVNVYLTQPTLTHVSGMF
jgi:hypothetical protein